MSTYGQQPGAGGVLLSPLASLREYFAAHAPEVPEWFQLPVPRGLSITDALRQQPAYLTLTLDDVELLRQSDNDDGELELERLPPRLHAIAVDANRLCSESWQANYKAKQENPRERFFAWRWYYADQMLAGRSA